MYCIHTAVEVINLYTTMLSVEVFTIHCTKVNNLQYNVISNGYNLTLQLLHTCIELLLCSLHTNTHYLSLNHSS